MNNNLFDEYLQSMNFLNETSIHYPSAISFGSGRPREQFFQVEEVISGIKSFVEGHKPANKTVNEYFNYLGQYNLTKGIINESIARLLENDEHIKADPENIIMTDGAQEAMAIVINTLFGSRDDVLMVSDPSYVGFVGYAKIAGISISPVPRLEDSINLDLLEETIIGLRNQGKRPRVLYEIPDFNNPTGSYMPLKERKQLLKLAEKYDFYIVEDNPYGYYIYDTEKIPTLKALDPYDRVIYIGSFAKTIFPSLRLGYLVADIKIKQDQRIIHFAEECKKVKSFMTVNTSTLVQAMAGALLEKESYSLKAFCEPRIEHCQSSRDTLFQSIERNMDSTLKWKKPKGGFFMSGELPFELHDELILECVKQYGVIICPMYMFCIDKQNGRNQIRLAFSNLTAEQMEEGVHRLANFVYSRV